MKLNPDDPKLTAYVLDELDATERKAIAAELDNADQCRHEIEQIAHTAALVEAELAAEPLPRLTYEQQAAIEAALEPAPDPAGARRSSLLAALWEPNLLRRAAGFAAAVAAVYVALMFASRVPTHISNEPRQVLSAIPKAAKTFEKNEAVALDEAFARWAAPYQRFQIPLVPLEEVAKYVPPEVRAIPPSFTIRNGNS